MLIQALNSPSNYTPTHTHTHTHTHISGSMWTISCMRPNEWGMLSVIWKIRAAWCETLFTGGVYFEASARENHEGVHTAFLHLCQEVRAFVHVVHEGRGGFSLHATRGFPLMEPFYREISGRYALWIHRTVKGFHFLWELWLQAISH